MSAVILGLSGLATAGLLCTVLVSWLRRYSPQGSVPNIESYIKLRGTDRTGRFLGTGQGTKILTQTAVWSLEGMDHGTMGRGTQDSMLMVRIAALNQMADSGARFTIMTVRAQAPVHTADEGPTNDIVSSTNAHWRKYVNATTLRTEHYLIASIDANVEKAHAKWAQVAEAVESGWRDYGPKRLQTVPQAMRNEETGQGYEIHPAQPFAELLSPLTRPRLRPDLGHNASDTPLARAIAADVLQQTKDGVWGYRHGNEYGAMSVVAIKGLPNYIGEQPLERLQALPNEIIISHQLLPASRTMTMARWQQSASRNLGSWWGTATSKDSMGAVMALRGETNAPAASVWDYSLTILAYGRGPTKHAAEEAANETALKVERCMLDAGYTPIRNGPGANAAWWALWPSPRKDPRPWRMLSHAIAVNLPLAAAPKGVREHDWAPNSITVFPTLGGSQYDFTFHPTGDRQATGHIVLIGKTGGGKTTLINHLVFATLALPDSRVAVFDRLNGCEIAVRSAGGRYITFDAEKGGQGLNPMQLPDTPENRSFLRSWLRQLATEPEAPPERQLTATAADEIANCVAWSYDFLDPNERSLRNMVDVAFHPEGRAFQNLKKWIGDEQYGTIFNAATDSLPEMDAQQRLLGFECTAALADPVLAPPLVAYLMHRIRESAKRSAAPHLVVIDETEPMLRNPEFCQFFREGLQEGRKLRTVYVSCFQHPGAVTEGLASSVIRSQCPTIIFLPNKRAEPEDYAPFGLTEPQLEFVRGKGSHSTRYAALVKRYDGDATAVLNTDLSGLGKWLSLYASGRPDVNEFKRLTKELGLERGVQKYLDR